MPLSWKAGSESTAHTITQKGKIISFLWLFAASEEALSVCSTWTPFPQLWFPSWPPSPWEGKMIHLQESEWNIPQIFISLSKWFSVFRERRDFDCSELVFPKYLSSLFIPFPMIRRPIISSNKILQNSISEFRIVLEDTFKNTPDLCMKYRFCSSHSNLSQQSWKICLWFWRVENWRRSLGRIPAPPLTRLNTCKAYFWTIIWIGV